MKCEQKTKSALWKKNCGKFGPYDIRWRWYCEFAVYFFGVTELVTIRNFATDRFLGVILGGDPWSDTKVESHIPKIGKINRNQHIYRCRWRQKKSDSHIYKTPEQTQIYARNIFTMNWNWNWSVQSGTRKKLKKRKNGKKRIEKIYMFRIAIRYGGLCNIV